MIKYLFIIISIFLMSCVRTHYIDPKIRFSGYYIPIEGGRVNLKLDSITPLRDLIPQLATKYELYETNKGYWIGYNDLMFSIAVYSDRAIEPLVKFIDTTSSYKGKVAALYTLHLIGINCKIKGRTYEEFTNKKARKALINQLANNDSMQDQIMLLLIRDPRESDIPELFHIMDSSRTDCWAITSGLLRYNLRNIPVAQDVPEKLLSIKTNFSCSDNFPNNELLNNAFKFFTRKYSEFVNVEDTLCNYNYQMPIRIGFGKFISLGYLIRFSSMTDYCFIGPNFQYFYKDGKINFCSAMTIKYRWIDWWNSQSILYIDSLKASYKKIGVNRI